MSSKIRPGLKPVRLLMRISNYLSIIIIKKWNPMGKVCIWQRFTFRMPFNIGSPNRGYTFLIS